MIYFYTFIQGKTFVKNQKKNQNGQVTLKRRLVYVFATLFDQRIYNISVLLEFKLFFIPFDVFYRVIRTSAPF